MPVIIIYETICIAAFGRPYPMLYIHPVNYAKANLGISINKLDIAIHYVELFFERLLRTVIDPLRLSFFVLFFIVSNKTKQKERILLFASLLLVFTYPLLFLAMYIKNWITG